MIAHVSILNDLPHLRIQEGVSNYHLFVLDVFLEVLALEREVVKIE